MTDIKTGIDKARDIRNKIASETVTKTNNEVEILNSAEISNTLATIGANKNLMSMYAESADLGSENLGGESLPLLKIHAAGKSLGNQLANGEQPHDGYFYYKKTQQEFKDVLCHILTISEGFRADGLEGKTNVFNQILGGVIIDDGDLKPFLMYFTGTKLQKLWDFGKEASKWTKLKPVGIPMFALTVKLTSERVVDGIKSWFVTNFEISKDLEGNPELVQDETEFRLLRDNVVKVKDMIDRLIANKATEDTAQIPSNEDTDSAGRKITDIIVDDGDFDNSEPKEELPFA